MTQANVLAQIGSTSGPTFRNRIINGAMVISQRGTSFSSPNNYTLDRFAFANTGGQTYTVTQSSTAPAGFTNSLLMTNTNSVAAGTTNYQVLYQVIEGYNIADLAWGAASAKTVTVSFWVNSSVTGNYGLTLRGGAGPTYYVSSYSIPVANTWTYITLTVPGCTTDTWNTTTSNGIALYFDLGVGSTYSASVTGSWATGNVFGLTGGTKFSATSGATFYITGVQLEVGSSATGYEYRQFTTELQLCQRYCYVLRSTGTLCQIGVMTAQATTNGFLSTYLPTTPRVYPTGITASSATCLNTYIANSNVTTTAIAIASGWQTTGNYAEIYLTVASGLTVGQAGPVYFNTGTATIEFTGMEL